MYIYSKDYKKIPVQKEVDNVLTSFYVEYNGQKIVLAYYYQESEYKYNVIIMDQKEHFNHLSIVPNQKSLDSESSSEYFIWKYLLTASMNYFCERFQSQQDIYNYVVKNKIKGIPKNCVHCIIAKILDVWYSPISNTCQIDPTAHKYPNICLDNKNLIRFALDFDSGRYPELVLDNG